MITILMGIDPGKTGAVSYRFDGGGVQQYGTMIDSAPQTFEGWTALISEIVGDDRVIVGMEEYNIRFGQDIYKGTVKNLWNNGRLAGWLEAITGLKPLVIHPNKWKKAILGKANAQKEDAIQHCRDRHPDANLLRTPRCRVPDHNRADAVCILDYVEHHRSEL